MWDEILLLEERRSNNSKNSLKMDPSEPKKKLFSIKSTPTKKLKAAFVYDKEPSSSVWIYGHELGRHDIDAKYADRIETLAVCGIDDNDKLAKALRELIEDKVDVIFTTGPEMLPEALKAAVEFPEVKILNCSLNMSTSHVRTYYARMYEAKFISGIIAGSLCKDGKLGYLADYPIYGTIANINAFAQGALLVNPRAKVYLTWSKVVGSNPRKFYKRRGISYVSGQDMVTPKLDTREFGLYHYKGADVINLAMPLYNWGAFYERILNAILAGNWKQDEKEQGTKSLNYWWGMSSGIIDVICSSSHLPAGTVRLANLMAKLIKSGEVEPFYGELRSQDGQIKTAPDSKMSPDEIMQMKWLCDNVIGSVPDISELVDEAKDVVLMQGLSTAENLELKMTTDILKQTDKR
jgi:basic membrane lipoprotein Med (substrate-binding protein (PBP1-ABC) superfamily)